MTPEERQQRADNDELSTVELPLFILDNVSTSEKIKEWDRSKMTPHREFAVEREDIRTMVRKTSHDLPTMVQTSNPEPYRGL